MPGQIARRPRGAVGRRYGARASGWVRGAVSAARAAGSVWKVAKKAYQAKQKYKPKRKSATKPFGGGPISVEPQTINHGSVSLRLAKSPKKVPSLGRWIYTQQNNGRVQAGIGLQGASVILGHNTISQLLVDTADTTSFTGLQFKDDVFSMNPYQTITGSGIFTSVAQPAQDRIMCRSVRTKLMLANNNNAPAVVVLYWVLSKKSHQGTPFDRWDDFLRNGTALGQGVTSAPQQSDVAYTPGNTGVPKYDTYGQEPGTVVTWRQHFKILRRREYHLGFGAVQSINYNINVNKMFDRTLATQHNAMGSAGYPGGTVWLCMVVRGTPVDISLLTGTDTGSVTTSGNEIGWTASVEYTYTGLAAKRLDFNRVRQGFPVPAGAAVETELMGANGVAVDNVNA